MLVKINPADYGLKESKAKQISDMFKPMLDRMVDLEKEFNEISGNEITQDLCSRAKELRLKYVKVRTGTAEIHKGLKQFYLQGGRFVDGWRNAQLMASQGIEDKLMSIERHYEILEAERIKKLQGKRAKELEKYEVEIVPGNLGEMQYEVWNNYMTGTKTNYEIRKEAEKKAEQERIQKEKEEKLRQFRISESASLAQFIQGWDETDFSTMDQEVYSGLLSDANKKKSEHEARQEQIRKDNERLQKEILEKERKRIAGERQRLAKEEADRKAREEKHRKEREVHEAELKKEREEKKRIEDELAARKKAEEKAEAGRLAEIEAEKSKGDEDKITDLINDLDALKTKYTFQSEASRKMYAETIASLEKIIAHIVCTVPMLSE